MGLFDGKILEQSDKLAANLDKRSGELEVELGGTSIKDPGKTLVLKITIFVLRELANIIRNTARE